MLFYPLPFACLNPITYLVVIGCPSLPVYAGGKSDAHLISFCYHRIRTTESQVKALGMKIEIFDPAGNNIEMTGEAGELVVTRPHPSLPSKFWGDDAMGTKFLKAYYDMYPGVLDLHHS